MGGCVCVCVRACSMCVCVCVCVYMYVCVFGGVGVYMSMCVRVHVCEGARVWPCRSSSEVSKHDTSTETVRLGRPVEVAFFTECT